MSNEGLQGILGGCIYLGLQEVTRGKRGYKGLQGLQGVTRVYNFERRLQVVTKGYMGLQ